MDCESGLQGQQPLANGLAEPIAGSSTLDGEEQPSAEAMTSATTSEPSANASRSSQSRFIAAGDIVIIFLSRDRPPMALTVAHGQQLTNAYGSFSHDDMVGLPFGAKMASRNRRGFIHLLRPTPELWTLALPHRTQILYSPDMSFIAAHLGLTPGARMIEAGTGSGSFSHYATRCVARRHTQSSGYGWKGRPSLKQQQRRGGGTGRGQDDAVIATAPDAIEGDKVESEEEQEKKEPVDEEEAEVLRQLARQPDPQTHPREGHVWSFEFNAGRAVKAWDEFAHHGLFGTLSLHHRNVVKLGFGLESVADAVFLDLPAPWEALHHAAQAMRQDVATRICCFSPCVEQVLKTVAALRRGGIVESGGEDQSNQSSLPTFATRWTDIETYECLSRTHLSVWTGAGTMVPNVPIDEAILRIRQVEEKKSRRRDIQIARARNERLKKIKAEDEGGESAASANAHQTQNHVEGTAGHGGQSDKHQTTSSSSKRKREDENDHFAAREESSALFIGQQRDGKKPIRPSNIFSRPMNEMRGHTSYLTFATLLPRNFQREPDPTLERERELANRKQHAIERAQKRKEEAREASKGQ